MKVNAMVVYDGCPELEKIARVRARLAAIQRERREREKAPKRWAPNSRKPGSDSGFR